MTDRYTVSLSSRADRDLSHILANSEKDWGQAAQHRYAALIAAALDWLALTPHGPGSSPQEDIDCNVRSLHLRHVRIDDRRPKVAQPAHLLVYEIIDDRFVRVLAILHERMDAATQLRR